MRPPPAVLRLSPCLSRPVCVRSISRIALQKRPGRSSCVWLRWIDGLDLHAHDPRQRDRDPAGRIVGLRTYPRSLGGGLRLFVFCFLSAPQQRSAGPPTCQKHAACVGCGAVRAGSPCPSDVLVLGIIMVILDRSSLGAVEGSSDDEPRQRKTVWCVLLFMCHTRQCAVAKVTNLKPHRGAFSPLSSTCVLG